MMLRYVVSIFFPCFLMSFVSLKYIIVVVVVVVVVDKIVVVTAIVKL